MSETLYCYLHPQRETTLRCNHCERPICASCAVRTPTGYRCRECVRSQQKIFNTALWYDFLTGPVITMIGSALASVLVSMIAMFTGFFIFFIAAAVAGGAGAALATLASKGVHKRRSRALFLSCAAGVVLGAVPVVLFLLFSGDLFGLIAQAIYLVVATPTVYSRLAGIQL
ncbi:MAG: hypothetical protein ACP5QU_00425 [Anaerolineae bacterium]